jgi:hypothetical protein
VLYWTLLLLNLVFVTIWGSLKFWRNYEIYKKKTPSGDNLEFYSQILSGLMLTISFAILIYSILKIRSFIIYNGLRNLMNSKIICLHVVCFGSYVSANVLLFAEIGVYSFGDQSDTHAIVVMLMWILNLIL